MKEKSRTLSEQKIHKAFTVSPWREERDWPEILRGVLLLWMGTGLLLGWLTALLGLDCSLVPVCLFLWIPSILTGAIIPEWSAGRGKVCLVLMGLLPLLILILPPLREGREGLIRDAYHTLAKRGIIFFSRGSETDAVWTKTAVLLILSLWIMLLMRWIVSGRGEYSWLFCICLLLIEMRCGTGEDAFWFLAWLFWFLLFHISSMRAYIMLVIPLLVLTVTAETLSRHSTGGVWREAWINFRYGGDSRGLPRGRLEDAGSFDRGEETVLTLNNDRGDFFYLKGFVGTLYRDNAWIAEDKSLEDVEKSILGSEEDFFFWLHDQGCSGWNQLAQKMGKGEKETLSVRNLGADRRNLYLPYELTGSPLQLEKDGTAVSVTGETLLATGLRGQKNYDLKMYPSLAGQISPEKGKKKTRTGQPYNIYEEYVDRTCLALPMEVRETLLEELGGVSTVGVDDPLSVVKRVRKWMGDRMSYRADPGPVPENEDFVKWFFSGEAAGYDVHYATIAVMLFRYYGIPSRYVEGYLVEGSNEVREAAAHAWPEIYLSGLGWVPVEVMKDYQKRMPSYLKEDEELFSGDNKETKPDSPKEEKKPSPGEKTGEKGNKEEKNGSESPVSPVASGPGKGILPAVLILFILMGLLPVLSGRAKRIMRPPLEKTSPVSYLILWYQYCMFLIYLLEDDPGERASMAVDNRLVRWEERWIKRHPEVDTKTLRRVGLLRQKAIYRRQGISRKEAESAKGFLEKESRFLCSCLTPAGKIRARFGIRPSFLAQYRRRHD